MKAAVILFPGSNREGDAARALKQATGRQPDIVWHADHDLPQGTDLVVLPGGFSYVPDCRDINRQSSSGAYCGTDFGGSEGGAAGDADGFGGSESTSSSDSGGDSSSDGGGGGCGGGD